MTYRCEGIKAVKKANSTGYLQIQYSNHWNQYITCLPAVLIANPHAENKESSYWRTQSKMPRQLKSCLRFVSRSCAHLSMCAIHSVFSLAVAA